MIHAKRLNHLAVVVDDIEAALVFWRDGLGMEVDRVQEVVEQQATVAFLPLGDSDIELVRPTTEDSGIARFLGKRGPGMHHICLEVDDLDTLLERLKGMGMRLINPEPVAGAGGERVAFIHPESAYGVLVELSQSGS